MDPTIEWLLGGDASIRYMAHRDLLRADAGMLARLQSRIEHEGFCARLLSLQNESGHWGIYYYQPKWTSTHYTLLELKNMCLPRSNPACREIVQRMFGECQLESGALNLSKHDHPGDICVDGMILGYASYFLAGDARLDALAARLTSVQLPDGGFSWDTGAVQGDPHTTLCVLEGFAQYAATRPDRAANVALAVSCAEAFLLQNDLFAESSDKRFKKLTYPHRYRYDLLRALVYFAARNAPFDARMRPALEWLAGKRKQGGFWPLEYAHPGNVHFEMEPVGQPSRFVTLKAMTVLDYFSHIGAFD